MSSVAVAPPKPLDSPGEIHANPFALSDLPARSAALSERLAAQAAEGDGTQFPTQEFGWLAEDGWLAASLRPALGGLGLGSEPGTALPLLLTLKHVGRGQLPVGRIYEGHFNALLLIQLFGTPEQVKRYAADARDAGRVFGVWNAEGREGGVQIQPLGDGRFRLEGGKLFASGLGHVDRPIVTGRLPDGGWQMCVVPMDEVRARADFSWWRPLGMEATVSGAVDYTGIEIGAECLLGEPDAYYRDPWFNGGAIRFVAVQLGGAEALYDAARAYLHKTGQAEHPAQRTRIAELAIALQSGELWLRGAAAMAEQPGVDHAALIAYVGMARMAVETICLDTIRTVERCVGARGLLKPWPFERLIRDLTMYLRQPAPDAIVERIGRHALADTRPTHAQWLTTPFQTLARHE